MTLRPLVPFVVLWSLIAPKAFALPISVTASDTITQSGDTLLYNFAGLPTSSVGGGTLTLFTLGSGLDGIDLGSSTDEFMDVFFDGTNLGRYECGTANDGGLLIPGAVGSTDCLFSLPIPVSAGLMASSVADGAVGVSLAMGSQVNFFPGENDTINARLEFSSGPAAVPAPATLALMVVGLLGLRMRRGA